MPKTFNNIVEITNEWSQAILVEIYKKSQELAPVKSGALKASGSFTLGPQGGKIVYDAPHAGDTRRNQSGGDYEWKVKSHRRTSKNGKSVMVRNYTRKVTQRTSPTTTKPTKNNFLDKAAEEVMADSKLLERLWLQVGGGSAPTIKSDDKAPY